MSITLPLVAVLLVWAGRRGLQVWSASRQHSRLISAYRAEKEEHGRNVSYRTYAPESEQSDYAKAAYLGKLQDAQRVQTRLDGARNSLSRLMGIAGFFSKRWAGLSNGMTLIDVAVVLVVTATLYPGLLHMGVDQLHKVGSDTVAWVVGTSQDSVPALQEFLRNTILGMDQSETAMDGTGSTEAITQAL